jgi:hypothetical protein
MYVSVASTGCAHTIAANQNGLSHAQRADSSLRDEESHLHVLCRQHRYDGRAGGHPFALLVECVGNQSGLRGGLGFLLQPPLRLRQRIARTFGLGGGGRNLVGTRREPRYREIGFQLIHTRLIALLCAVHLSRASRR